MNIFGEETLPGGGRAAVCAKRDTYPDGREFVGYGISPDVAVDLTLDELLGEKDLTLLRGIEVLNSIIMPE